MLIDSHCHLTFPELAEQVEDVLARGRAAGVTAYVNVCTTPADAWRAFDLLGGHPEVFFAVGIHPHEAARAGGELKALAGLLKPGNLHPTVQRRIVALGEVGLDFHYDFAPRDVQQEVLRAQLRLACEHNLPVVIHAREAEREVVAALNEFPPLRDRAVFHCFSGDVATAEEVLAAGYWISLTGIVTFKNAQELQAVAQRVPAERLMVETDAPYLSPQPVRKQRPCEPAFVVHTAERVAALRGVSREALAELTTANARRFFNLPKDWL